MQNKQSVEARSVIDLNAPIVNIVGQGKTTQEPIDDDDIATKKYVDDNAGATQSEVTTPITFTGPWAAPIVVNVTFYKVGKIAEMMLPQFNALHNTDSKIFAAAASIPAAFTPSMNNFTQTIVVKNGPELIDGSDDYLGSCIVRADGSIIIAAAERNANDVVVFTDFDAAGETVGTSTSQCIMYCL